jgi:hypothetical protein
MTTGANVITREDLYEFLSHLAPAEAVVFDGLRFDRHQPRYRLEQERVGLAG